MKKSAQAGLTVGTLLLIGFAVFGAICCVRSCSTDHENAGAVAIVEETSAQTLFKQSEVDSIMLATEKLKEAAFERGVYYGWQAGFAGGAKSEDEAMFIALRMLYRDQEERGQKIGL